MIFPWSSMNRKPFKGFLQGNLKGVIYRQKVFYRRKKPFNWFSLDKRLLIGLLQKEDNQDDFYIQKVFCRQKVFAGYLQTENLKEFLHKQTGFGRTFIDLFSVDRRLLTYLILPDNCSVDRKSLKYVLQPKDN